MPCRIWRRGAARRGCDRPIPGRLRAEAQRVDQLGARYVFLGDPDYPPLLTEAEGSLPR